MSRIDRSPVSYTHLDVYKRQAKGFAAAGVQPGDRIGFMCKTSFEWSLVDVALFYAGAVMVPIYETSSALQVQWILEDSGACLLYTSRCV